ncbi:MAG: ClbS/DfsB family four-helix bundle protein [Candidatus Babeliales bacterium]
MHTKFTFINVHSPLSQSILKEYEKLVRAIIVMPEKDFFKKKMQGTGGLVSAADILAYQIGWGKLLIGWYVAGINQVTVEMPGEGFSTWDYTAIAQYFYHKYADWDKSRFIKEFEKVITKIIDITEKEYASGNLNNVGVWSWCTLKSGKAWPLSKWITVNTIAPYKRARSLLKKSFSFS